MKIALLGNPNTGKSTVFNSLTGLKQHVGNFPGVTVDKKTGYFSVKETKYELIDFPGTYSIYPRTKDEQVVYNVLSDQSNKDYPDLAIVVVDASNLERNLLLFTQIYDLKIPTILVLNMSDQAFKRGIKIDVKKINEAFPGVSVVETNARVGLGMNRIKEEVHQFNNNSKQQKSFISDFKIAAIDDLENQTTEAKTRYIKIKKLLDSLQIKVDLDKESKSNKIDKCNNHTKYYKNHQRYP